MSKEKSRGHKILVILLLFVILALAAISCVLALRLTRRGDSSLSGRWRMKADLTETARSRADSWLRRAALGDQISAADYIPRLALNVRLTLTEDGRWTREIEEDGYEEARAEAEQGLAKALTELLRLRIADAGRPPETAAEAEARIENAIGMSAEDYMRDYGPALLPTPDELHAFYDGGGSYQTEGQCIRLDGEEIRFLADDGLLVLMRPEGTEVYERAN